MGSHCSWLNESVKYENSSSTHTQSEVNKIDGLENEEEEEDYGMMYDGIDDDEITALLDDEMGVTFVGPSKSGKSSGAASG